MPESGLLADAFIRARLDTGSYTSELSAFRSAVTSQFSSIGKTAAGMFVGGLALAGINQFSGGVTGLVTKLFSLSGSLEQSKVSFGVMLGSAKAAEDVIARLTRFAADTPFEMPELNEVSRGLLTFGERGDQLMDTLTILGNAASGTSSDFGMIGLIFNQIRGAGKLLTQDFRQLSTRGVLFLTDIAKHFGVTEQVAQSMISTGKIGFEDVRKILAGLSAEGGRFHNMMAKQSRTFTGLASTIRDNFGMAIVEAGKPLFDLAKLNLENLISFMNTDTFKVSIKMIASGLKSVIDLAVMLAGNPMAKMVAKFTLFGAVGLAAIIATGIGFKVMSKAVLYLISPITGLGSALAATAIRMKGAFSTATAATINKIGSAATRAGSAATTAGSRIVTAFTSGYGMASNAVLRFQNVSSGMFGSTLGKIRAFTQGLMGASVTFDWMAGRYRNADGTFSNSGGMVAAGARMRAAMSSAFSSMKILSKDFFNGLRGNATAASSRIGAEFRGMGLQLRTAIQNPSLRNSWFVIQRAGIAASVITREAWKAIGPKIGSALTASMKATFAKIGSMGVFAASGIGRGIKGGIGAAGRGLGGAAGGLGMLAMVSGVSGPLGAILMTAPLVLGALGSISTGFLSLMTPVGLVAIAIGAGAAAWFKFSEKGQEALASIKAALEPFIETFKIAFDGVKDAFAAGDLALAGKIAITGLRIVVAEGLLALSDSIGGIFGDTIGAIGGLIAGGDFAGAWRVAVEGMGSVWAMWSEGVITTFTSVARAIVNVWQEATSAITRMLIESQSKARSVIEWVAKVFPSVAAAQKLTGINLAESALGPDLDKEDARSKELHNKLIETKERQSASLRNDSEKARAAGNLEQAAAARKMAEELDSQVARMKEAGAGDVIGEAADNAAAQIKSQAGNMFAGLDEIDREARSKTASATKSLIDATAGGKDKAAEAIASAKKDLADLRAEAGKKKAAALGEDKKEEDKKEEEKESGEKGTSTTTIENLNRTIQDKLKGDEAKKIAIDTKNIAAKQLTALERIGVGIGAMSGKTSVVIGGAATGFGKSIADIASGNFKFPSLKFGNRKYSEDLFGNKTGTGGSGIGAGIKGGMSSIGGMFSNPLGAWNKLKEATSVADPKTKAELEREALRKKFDDDRKAKRAAFDSLSKPPDVSKIEEKKKRIAGNKDDSMSFSKMLDALQKIATNTMNTTEGVKGIEPGYAE